jgi:hypothetical protein
LIAVKSRHLRICELPQQEEVRPLMIDHRVSPDPAVEDGETASCRVALRDDHDARLALCAELERVADMLPALPAPARVRRICSQIECVTTLNFRRAAALLTRIARGLNTSALADLGQQIVDMQALDAVHGEDVVTVFWDSTARGAIERPGEFGYMLRCFFDGCRRVIALEDALLLLLESQQPTPAPQPGA